MAAQSAPRPGGEAFARPTQVNQRRDEAVRGYFQDGAPLGADGAHGGPRAPVLALAGGPARLDNRLAGLLLTVPDLVALDLPGLARTAGYPGTAAIPPASRILSLLALKLTATRRVSHVDDLLTDPASALFAGLPVLPKKSALTDYSYRLSHDHQQRFLAALDQKMIGEGLATSEEAIFDLDFHSVMAWASHCSFADCGGQNRPVWPGGGP